MVNKEKNKNSTLRAEKDLIIVLGMHRSGTSMITNMLENAGYFVGEGEDILNPAFDNPKGFFENRKIIAINDLILQLCGGSWDNPPSESDIKQINIDPYLSSIIYKIFERKNLVVIKDPRMCLTFPVWKELLPDNLKIIYVKRLRDAVISSLNKRNEFDESKSKNLYQVYNERAVNYCNGFETISLDFEDMFTEKRDSVLANLGEFLNSSEDMIQIGKNIIDPQLNHHKIGEKIPFNASPSFTDQISKKPTDKKNKILVGGTGRAGTTFLISFLSALDINTGYPKDIYKKISNTKDKCGLEDLFDDAFVIKSPRMTTDNFAEIAESYKIQHFIIPIRDLNEAAKSRIKQHRYGRVNGGLVGVNKSTDMLGYLERRMGRLISNLVLNEIPYTFLKFPKFVKDENYLFEKLLPIFPQINRRDFTQLFNKIALNTDWKPQIKPVVSIIMLTYNAIEYTKKCVKSILRFTKYPYEIIFVDNASTDGSLQYLRELVDQNENFRLIENKTNKGFAGGNNQGVAVAEGKYVMLLNNDVLVSEDWLTRLVTSLEKHDKIGIVGPVTNHISGRQSYTGQYEGDDYLQFEKFIRKENKGKLTPRRRLAGFAMLMRKNVFEDVNGFDETFGVGNFEDDDLSLKVRSKGFALMVDESVFIHHYGSQTFKANKIDILENLNERMPIFTKKWPDVDYEELLEIKNPLDEYHSDLMNKGINELEKSDFISAEKLFLKILHENPISDEALYGLVLCARNCQDKLKAMKYVNTLLQLNPDHVEGLNQFGMILVENDNLDEAKNTFINVIRKSPDFIDAQRNLAEVFILDGDFDSAVKAYLTILRNHPEDIPSLLRMAELNREADNNKEASEWAKLVLELEPEHPVAGQFVS